MTGLMENDERQEKLRRLFGNLRHVKQFWMPIRLQDPVEQAQHDQLVKADIQRIEDEIERVMGDV